MTTWISAIVAGMLLVGTAPRAGAAACDPAGADAVDVANAREAVAASCDCEGAASPGVYKRCAKDVARASLTNPKCLSTVTRCAAKSTCGRPGAVVCCRTNAVNETKGGIVRSVAHCHSPRTGSACIGNAASSVCDACDADGCAKPAVCGDRRIDVGEQCDGEGFCNPDCTVAARGCCQGESTCRDSAIFSSAQLYFSCQPDTPTRGTCVGGTTCQPLVVTPDEVCCAFDGGCTTESYSTAEGYHGATYACLLGSGAPMIGGVCGADQRCHPPD